MLRPGEEPRAGTRQMLSRMVANDLIIGCRARMGSLQAWPGSKPPSSTGALLLTRLTVCWWQLQSWPDLVEEG